MNFTYKKIIFSILILLFISFVKISLPSNVWAQCGFDCQCGCNTSGGCNSCQGKTPADTDCSNDGPTNQCGGDATYCPNCPSGTHQGGVISSYCAPRYTECNYSGTQKVVIQRACGNQGRGDLVYIYACVSNCQTTTPTNLVVTTTSTTSSLLSWTPGTGGTTQSVFVGSDLNAVSSGCPGGTGSGCVVAQTGLSSSQSSLSTGFTLTAGTIYYYMVLNYNSSSCYNGSAVAHEMSSCELSPASGTINVGDTATYTSSISNSSSINSVTYSSNNGNVVVIPASDTAYVYQTNITGVNSGTSFITENVYAFGEGSPICTNIITVTVNAANPWWQVIDGDVTTNGNLSSEVPLGLYFNTVGAGGFPGVPVFGSTFNLTSENTKISVNRWMANTTTTESRLFNYSYFENLIPADTLINDISLLATGGVETGGYEWFKITGNLDINSDINIGSRKVILFVESGNLNLNAKVNLTDDSGFFGTFVNGSINVDPLVNGGVGPAIEGIYMADSGFSTGLGTTPLYIRGSVASYGGISLQRDLDDDSTPAELFEFAPDQILLFPDKLGFRAQRWVEVAP